MWKKCLKVVFVVALLTAIFIESYRNTYKYNPPDSDVATRWVEMFLDGSFGACDSIVKYDSDKLIGGNDMYEYTLDHLSKSVKSANVETQGEEVSIVMVVRKYEGVSEISFDTDELSEVRESYLNGEIEESELTNIISGAYDKAFKSCVDMPKTEDTEECSCVVRVEDGKLVGVYDLVRQLYSSSGMLDNVKYFEDNALSYLNVRMYALKED